MKLALTTIGFLLGLAIYVIGEVLIAPAFVTHAAIGGLLICGLLLQLNYGAAKFSRILFLSLGIAIIFSLVFGKLADTSDISYNLPIYLLLILSTYISASYLNVYLIHNKWHFPYHDLFEFSWNSAFIIFISTVFTGTLWMILLLFGLLLKMLELTFFMDFIFSQEFMIIATFTFLGTGMAIAKQYLHIITSLRNILFGLAQLLLPVVAFLGLAFIIILTIKWQTQNTESIVLILLPIIAIFILNAVIQEANSEPNYPTWLKATISTFFVLLPILSLLTIYNLSATMAKDGLNPVPIQILVISSLIAIYSLIYAGISFFSLSKWFGYLPSCNRYLAVLVVITSLLIGTNFLDPFKLSVNNQTQRLLAGIHSKNTFGNRVYLRGAKLTRADLRGLDMSYYDLLQADLSGANLAGSNLSYSNLSGALLQFTNMNNTNLAGADFNGANISDANMHDAILSGAYLGTVIGMTQQQLDSACGKPLRLHHGKSIKPQPPTTLPEGLVFKDCAQLNNNKKNDSLAIQQLRD